MGCATIDFGRNLIFRIGLTAGEFIYHLGVKDYN